MTAPPAAQLNDKFESMVGNGTGLTDLMNEGDQGKIMVAVIFCVQVMFSQEEEEKTDNTGNTG